MYVPNYDKVGASILSLGISNLFEKMLRHVLGFPDRALMQRCPSRAALQALALLMLCKAARIGVSRLLRLVVVSTGCCRLFWGQKHIASALLQRSQPAAVLADRDSTQASNTASQGVRNPRRWMSRRLFRHYTVMYCEPGCSQLPLRPRYAAWTAGLSLRSLTHSNLLGGTRRGSLSVECTRVPFPTEL